MDKPTHQELVYSINKTNILYEEKKEYLNNDKLKATRNIGKNINPNPPKIQSFIFSFFFSVGVSSILFLPFLYFGIQGVAYRLQQITNLEIPTNIKSGSQHYFYQRSLENLMQKIQVLSDYVLGLIIIAGLLTLIVYKYSKTLNKVKKDEK